MKKRMISSILLAVFMLVGVVGDVVLADTFTMKGVDGEWLLYNDQKVWAGQINVVDSAGQFDWGYCVEPAVRSAIGTPYNYTLGELDGYVGEKNRFGLIAADLIYRSKASTDVGKADLQVAIWSAYAKYESPSFSADYTALLESLFDIAYVENQCGVGQDLIVYRPVPEPATLLLLGIGLLGMGVAARRKFVR